MVAISFKPDDYSGPLEPCALTRHIGVYQNKWGPGMMLSSNNILIITDIAVFV